MRTITITRPGGRIRLAALAAMGLIMIAGGTASLAADPFRAGERATRETALTGLARAAVVARADVLARVLELGVADARTDAIRLEDRFEGALVDEVTLQDERGRPIAILRIRPDGRLRQAVSLGWHDPTATVGEQAAVGRARGFAIAAGLEPAGQPLVETDATGAGWSVRWPRVESGVPVPGDGLWIRLWADGSFQAAAETHSPLADRPTTLRSAAEASRVADAHLDAWFVGDARADVEAAPPVLAWVAPNDMFRAERPDAPDVVRRLGWLVRVTVSGETAERVRALELDLDAGDLTLLGGDVLR